MSQSSPGEGDGAAEAAQLVALRFEGHTALLTINRPKALNALTRPC
jgi:enoyl-CoA hydratase/carnithine racemase